jgi:hypothetical protein
MTDKGSGSADAGLKRALAANEDGGESSTTSYEERVDNKA